AARLSWPTDVVVSPTGDLYIADFGNHRVRKVTGGVITTVAGTGVAGYSGDGGAATLAKLVSPVGLDLDASANLYVADYGNSTVRKVNVAGIISTVAGTAAAGYSGDGGPATAAKINSPCDIAAVAGSLLI